MTAITDAKTVIETLIGRTATNDELTRIADAFVSARGNGIRIPSISPVTPAFADPENPTNEEKAQLFLDAMKWFGKQVVGANAEKVARQGNDAAVAAARAAAEADIS